MINGNIKNFTLAMLLHVILLVGIFHTVKITPAKKTPQKKPINSFLYTPKKQTPKKEEPVKPAEKIEAEKTEKQQTEIQQTEKQKTQQKTDLKEKEKEKKQAETIKPLIQQPNSKAVKDITQEKLKTETSTPVNNLPSALTQLNNLTQSLNDKMFAEESYQYGRVKSGSILHGKPEFVPHAKKKLTPDEIKKKNSQRVSSDQVVIKGDDGLCFIEKDLTSVGIAGVTAVQSFTCGKTKFDKAFDAHMKKVREKLGK